MGAGHCLESDCDCNLRWVSVMHISAADFQIEAPLSLGENEVHLWHLDLATAAAGEKKWQQILSEDEKSRAARFRFDRDRQCFSATRGVLRTILASYVGADPKTLAFGYAKNGKPYLNRNHSLSGSNQVEFNVSHSGMVALLAFARERAVGVDVERIRNNVEIESIAQRFFSKHEERQLLALPAAGRVAGFYRCWTRKEAFIKAVGIGLSLPLDQFDVSLAEGDGNVLLATRPDAGEAARWLLREVIAGYGYVGALCVQGHGWELRS